MRIQNISRNNINNNNNISFKRVYATGRDAINYDSILRSYFDELSKISKGYDVEIKTGKQFYISDDYHDEQIPIYPTTVSITPETNSAYHIIPKIKLYINPSANPCIGRKFEVKDIIETIKKGISLLKN